VADDIWCFFGKLEPPTKKNGGAMSNSCYIKCKDCYIVFDSGPTYTFAKQAYQKMSKISKLPVKYVINSHSHDDHWLGNSFYKDEFNATLIGPKAINENFKEGDKTRIFRVVSKDAIKDTKIVKVDITPQKKMSLKVGGVDFEIVPISYKAHTPQDLYLYLPKRDIIFSGDVVMNGRVTSNRDGSVIGQIKILKELKSKKFKHLIPGHGFNTNSDAADESIKYFTTLQKEIKKALEDDVDATEITKRVKLEELKDKAMYDILNARNIANAYVELEFLEE
jgi:glyoxylase-like metal-dependent hydrolase (beta-lactamase superfamily II)